MSRIRAFLLAPCRLGWLLVVLSLAIYSVATHQWILLLAAAAPLFGTLAGLALAARATHGGVPAGHACGVASDE